MPLGKIDGRKGEHPPPLPHRPLLTQPPNKRAGACSGNIRTKPPHSWLLSHEQKPRTASATRAPAMAMEPIPTKTAWHNTQYIRAKHKTKDVCRRQVAEGTRTRRTTAEEHGFRCVLWCDAFFLHSDTPFRKSGSLLQKLSKANTELTGNVLLILIIIIPSIPPDRAVVIDEHPLRVTRSHVVKLIHCHHGADGSREVVVSCCG